MRHAVGLARRDCFRGTTLHPLSEVVDGLDGLRAATYAAYRTSLGPDGAHLPVQFDDLVTAVTTFADPLAESAQPQMTWQAVRRQWQS